MTRPVDFSKSSHADRLLSALEFMVFSDEPVSVKELSEALNIPTSTAHRLLDLLADRGYADRALRRRYRTGTELFRLSAVINAKFELVAAARPILIRLVRKTGQTSMLALLTRERNKFLLAEKLDAPHPLRFRFLLHENLSLIWGALGRAILAELSETDLRRVLSESDDCAVSGEPVPTWAEAQTLVGDIRRHGYSKTMGQRSVPGAVGFAAPFFDGQGNVVGSVGTVSLEEFTPPEILERLPDAVRATAAELSWVLGYDSASREHSR